MNLTEINFSIVENPPQNEIELQSRIFKYCIKNNIDFIEFSNVSRNWSRINRFSENQFYNEPFATKKETMVEANERLSKYIKDNYLQKKDCVVWFSTFFGLVNCRFYDFKTDKNINIQGTAKEEQKGFKKLVDLYHSL